MSKKKSNTSKKSRKAQYRQSKKNNPDGLLKRPKELQRRNFMDLTPSQDEPVPQAQPQDPSTHEDSGAGVDQATSSPFNGFPSENGPPVNDESGRTHFN